MTRAEQLEKVKESLSITGEHLDAALGVYLDDVKLYLKDAGVLEDVIESTLAIGCICKGVADLYVNDKFSKYFYQRASQLTTLKGVD